MKKTAHSSLTRRERQIMDALYKLERASVAQVLAELPGTLNYSTVRAQLRILEEKGHVRHQEEGPRYVYFPAITRDVARRSALRHLVDTFFGGSAEQAAVALLGGESSRLSANELDRLRRLIARNSKESRDEP